MTYSKIEDKKNKRQAFENKIAAETHLYHECESFEEFELKRTICGITYRWLWQDNFKLYYFLTNYNNTLFEHIRDYCAVFCIITTITGVVALLHTICLGISLFSMCCGLIMFISTFILLIFLRFKQVFDNIRLFEWQFKYRNRRT